MLPLKHRLANTLAGMPSPSASFDHDNSSLVRVSDLAPPSWDPRCRLCCTRVAPRESDDVASSEHALPFPERAGLGICSSAAPGLHSCLPLPTDATNGGKGDSGFSQSRIVVVVVVVVFGGPAEWEMALRTVPRRCQARVAAIYRTSSGPDLTCSLLFGSGHGAVK